MRRRSRRLLHLLVALVLRALGGGSGGGHSETCAGCLICPTSPTRSSFSASRLVSSLSLAENCTAQSSRLLFATGLVKALSAALGRRGRTRRRTAPAAAYSFVSPPLSPQRSPPCTTQSKVLPGS